FAAGAEALWQAADLRRDCRLRSERGHPLHLAARTAHHRLERLHEGRRHARDAGGRRRLPEAARDARHADVEARRGRKPDGSPRLLRKDRDGSRLSRLHPHHHRSNERGSRMTGRTQNTDNLTPLERLEFELAHPPYHAFLRPQAVSVDAENGIVEIRLPFRPEFQRVPDKPEYHGGIIAGLL